MLIHLALNKIANQVQLLQQIWLIIGTNKLNQQFEKELCVLFVGLGAAGRFNPCSV